MLMNRRLDLSWPLTGFGTPASPAAGADLPEAKVKSGACEGVQRIVSIGDVQGNICHFIRRWLTLAVICLLSGRLAAEEPSATWLLEAAGVVGGLIVHVGCRDATGTVALRLNERCVVHGLDADPERIAAARARLTADGVYGAVSVELFDGQHLPYTDHLVNALVAETPIPRQEAMRVLAPGGVLLIKEDGAWTSVVKPRPEAMDEWTHYLGDADNNAVSADRLVGPPRHLRWTGAPQWPRSHEYTPSLAALVASDNKLFCLADEGMRGVYDQRLPERWFVQARDAFNGVLLWKVAVPNWGPQQWKNERHWSAPMSLPRRLVAAGGRVYVTLGYRAAVSVLDAATGRRLAVFEHTGNADELLLVGGRLIVRRRKTVPDYPDGAGPWNVHVRRRNAVKDDGSAASFPTVADEDQGILALDAQTGRVLWETNCPRMVTLSLAASEKHVCYHDFDDVVCLDIADGKELWRGTSQSWPDLTGTAGTLIMHDGMVFYTSDRAMSGWDAATGRRLWTGPRIARTTIRHPADLFIAGGLLWGGLTPDMDPGTIPREESPHAGRPMEGRAVQGLDPKTGEVKRELDIQRLITPGHHVRCYRAKATERFLLWPKRGVEFVDIVDGTNHERCNWFRGECSYGVVPANGLIYSPPHPCQCNLGVVLTGFNALAAKRPDSIGTNEPRLIHGPAFGKCGTRNAERGIAEADENPPSSPPPALPIRHSADWPMYRHDAARSGRTTSAVSVPLSEDWTAKIGGRLTPPVVAGGAVYLASIDRHGLYCLSAADGRVRWSFTAGGRIDSPPSVYRGQVMFGCRDGRVYCLRAADGALAWRFRAAPEERRIMAFEQLESPWPVSGSLLIVNDKVYFAAGRSSFLDGGVHLYALKPETGEVLHRHLFDGPWADISKAAGSTYHMDGVKADLLTSDGESIFLSFQQFDLRLNKHPAPEADGSGNRIVTPHLMPRNGFLDTTWFDRNSWSHGRQWYGRHFRSGAPATGQIVCFDDTTTWSLQVFSQQLFMSPRFVPGTGYLLRSDEASANKEEKRRGKAPGKPRVAVRVPLRARGMLWVGETLFLAGVPDVEGGEAFYAGLDGPAELWAISAKDGTKLDGLALDAPPVFDGLAAANGHLFVSLIDGTLRCLVPQWEEPSVP